MKFVQHLALALLASFALAARAQLNPFEQAAQSSYTGRFASANTTLRLKPEGAGFAGTLEFQGNSYTVQGQLKQGQLQGTFKDAAGSWPFSTVREGQNLQFTAGQHTETLARLPLPKLDGEYQGDSVWLKIAAEGAGYGGTVKVQGKEMPLSARETADELTGTVGEGTNAIPFTLAVEKGGLVFRTGDFRDVLRTSRQEPTRADSPAVKCDFENSLGMKFVDVPGTEVLFCIWETRVQDYEAFVKATSTEWEKPYFEQGPTHPAVLVSWDDAKLFCAWLTKEERKSGKISASHFYRLPTDEEWSWAVGIGDRESGATPKDKNYQLEGVYPWGTQWPPPAGAGNYADIRHKGTTHRIDNYDDGFPTTSPAGSFKANKLGICDLGGNVWEWCEDWEDGERGFRVGRGASWQSYHPFSLLSSYRSGSGVRIYDRGFRCVLVGGMSR